MTPSISNPAPSMLPVVSRLQNDVAGSPAVGWVRRNVGCMLLASAVIGAAHAAPPQELPTRWEVPPGDPLEHSTAGFAKVLCSAVYITGRDPSVAADEDGFFVSSREERRHVTKTVVDRERRAVHLTLPNGVTRSAKQHGDQGCITLPRGKDSVYFT